MRSIGTRDVFTLAALGIAAFIPLLYYGVQILCASYNPGYSFVHQVASELGSARSVRGTLFNLGITVQGTLTLIASLGFLRAALRLGVNRTLSLLVFLAVATNGIQMLWAAYFPLPDPRHAGHPPFVIAATLLPVLLTAALWKGSGPILKTYFVATLILVAAMIGMNPTNVRGLTQRIYTLTVFPPIAVAAIALADRYRKYLAGVATTGTDQGTQWH